MTSRENMQAKVRAILERANHPNTPQAEAETALAFAFRLMQKYGLDGHKTPSRPAQPLSASHPLAGSTVAWLARLLYSSLSYS